MTNLVEKFIVEVTVHRDEHPNFPYDNLLPRMRRLPRYMRKRIGYVTYEIRNIGSEEEHGEGDN